MPVQQHEDLGAGGDVEGRLRCHPIAFAGEVAQFVAQPGVLLVLERGDVEDALQRPLHEAVELGSQELRDFFYPALVDVQVPAALEVLLHRVRPAPLLPRVLDLDGFRTDGLSPRLLGRLPALGFWPDGRRGWPLVDFLAFVVFGVRLLLLAHFGVGAGEQLGPLGLQLLHLLLGAGSPIAEDFLVPGVVLLLELEVVDGVLGHEVVDGEVFLGDLEAGLQVEQVVSDVELGVRDALELVEFLQFLEGLLEGGEAIGEQHVHLELHGVETLEDLFLVASALCALEQGGQAVLLLLVLLLQLHVFEALERDLHLQLLALLHYSI